MNVYGTNGTRLRLSGGCYTHLSVHCAKHYSKSNLQMDYSVQFTVRMNEYRPLLTSVEKTDLSWNFHRMVVNRQCTYSVAILCLVTNVDLNPLVFKKYIFIKNNLLKFAEVLKRRKTIWTNMKNWFLTICLTPCGRY